MHRLYSPIESALTEIADPKDIHIDFPARTLILSSTYTPEEIIKIINKTGYGAQQIEAMQSSALQQPNHHKSPFLKLLNKVISAGILDIGLKTIMLTGDHKDVAIDIAKLVGIDEVIAEVLLKDKAREIEKLQAGGEKVGMVGDGINDAPALAKAQVGFAVAAGTDVAIQSAAITLMRSSIHNVADAIEVSSATMKNIKQNLFGAFIYNIICIPIAAGVLYPFVGLLLNSAIAALAMALSDITVIFNASRLRHFTVNKI